MAVFCANPYQAGSRNPRWHASFPPLAVLKTPHHVQMVTVEFWVAGSTNWYHVWYLVGDTTSDEAIPKSTALAPTRQIAGCLKELVPQSQSVPSGEPVATRTNAGAIVQFAVSDHVGQGTLDG